MADKLISDIIHIIVVMPDTYIVSIFFFCYLKLLELNEKNAKEDTPKEESCRNLCHQQEGEEPSRSNINGQHQFPVNPASMDSQTLNLMQA